MLLLMLILIERPCSDCTDVELGSKGKEVSTGTKEWKE
jgi:hypothetical protein